MKKVVLLLSLCLLAFSHEYRKNRNDFRENEIERVMKEQNASAVIVGNITVDTNSDGIIDGNATNMPIRIVGSENGKLWVIRSKTDKNGRFRIKIPANKPFRFGAYCGFCKKPGFVWYAKRNPGVQPNTIFSGKW